MRVSVTDTGPGIPAEQRERIFERFVQGQDSDEPGAAGLGLAIVRDIVQAHGGRIFLDSEVGPRQPLRHRAATALRRSGLLGCSFVSSTREQ